MRAKRMKGDTLVFEQVLLFVLSVVIFISSFSMFSLYQIHYNSVSQRDQLTGVKELLSAEILRAAGSGDYNVSIPVDVPRSINNLAYIITLNQTGLNISIPETGDWEFSGLYGFNKTYNCSGRVTSYNGKIVIYKKGNSIIIR